MKCPKDGVSMNTVQLVQTYVDVCPQCQGIWFEETELKGLLFQFSLQKVADVENLISRWLVHEKDSTTSPRIFWQESTLMCPFDYSPMKKHYFAGSTIGIDQCQSCHGLWIDGEEFKGIWGEVKPNPLVDELGRAFIRDVNELSRKRDEDTAAVVKTMSTVSGLIANPYYSLFVIASFVIKAMLEKVKQE